MEVGNGYAIGLNSVAIKKLPKINLNDEKTLTT